MAARQGLGHDSKAHLEKSFCIRYLGTEPGQVFEPLPYEAFINSEALSDFYRDF